MAVAYQMIMSAAFCQSLFGGFDDALLHFAPLPSWSTCDPARDKLARRQDFFARRDRFAAIDIEQPDSVQQIATCFDDHLSTAAV